MRDARVADWQRRLRLGAAEWPIALNRYAFNGIPSLGSAEFPFSSPLTVISGPNGVGKTTLLRALWAALAPAAANEVIEADLKLVAGRATVDIRMDAGVETAEVEFSPDALRPLKTVDVQVMHIDAATESIRHQRLFGAFESGDDIINGVGFLDLDAAALSELNYILHREYRSIRLYEVEMEGIVPYFEVAYGDDRYDSRTMGSGEISAFYLWWMLNRAEAGSVLLVEEPEAFLSYACQESMARHLISVIVKKSICAVVTSHSAPLITAMPKESLRFLTRGQNGMQVISDQPPPILLKSIGIDPPLAGIIFVEDEAARLFCRLLLERLDASLARRINIELRNGHGDITAALRMTSNFEGLLKFIGLYDGDARAEVTEELAGRSAFLPGDRPIEKIFRDMVQADASGLAEATGNGHLGPILDNLEGADHHKWYKEVCKELGLTKAQLFPMLFVIWMRVPENAALATATYEAVAAIVSPGR